MNQISQVTTNAYIASLSGVRSNSIEDEIMPERMINLSTVRLEKCINHPLVDGLNYQEKFDEAVELGLESLRNDETIVVFCRAGQSRSAGVLATIIADEYDLSFNGGLRKVRLARKEVMPVTPIEWHGKHYLDEIDICDVIEDSLYDIDPSVIISAPEKEVRTTSGPLDWRDVIDDEVSNDFYNQMEKH